MLAPTGCDACPSLILNDWLSEWVAMRIGLQTWGSEGDIRPFLALGYGLVQAGHSVTLGMVNIDGRDFSAMATSLGLRAVPLGLPYFATRRPELYALAQQMVTLRNPLRQLGLVLEHLYDPVQMLQYEFAQELCATHDLVVGHFLVDGLAVAATMAQKPYASLMTVGTVPSAAQPPAGLPNWGPWANRLTWQLAGWIIQRQFGPRLNRLRRKAGLAPTQDALRTAFGSAQLNLISNSPTLYPPQPDWPLQHRVCGYLAPPSPPAALDPEVAAFLDAGPAPVYLTFGSMLTVDQPLTLVQDSVTAFLTAVAQTGVRAIVQAPWIRLNPTAPLGAHQTSDMPQVLRLSQAPHDQIFPRCAAIVHHGGAGSTHAALSAGCPAVIVPHAIDQQDWATKLARLGVAVPPLPRRQLTGARLAQRLTQVLTQPQYTARAQQLGAQLRAENGIATAVGLLEAFGRHPG